MNRFSEPLGTGRFDPYARRSHTGAPTRLGRTRHRARRREPRAAAPALPADDRRPPASLAAAFVAALRRRRPPRLDGWTLHLPGERPWAIDPRDHDVEARRGARGGGRRRAGAAWRRRRRSGSTACRRRGRPSSPTRGSTARSRCPRRSGPGRRRHRRADAAALPRARPRGGRPRGRGRRDGGARRARPARAAARRRWRRAARALLVHPGPAGAADAAGRPRWWAPVVAYVSQLHAAWWAWIAAAARAGRACACASSRSPGSPRSTASATASRGGEPLPVDPLTFVETSSYGERAIDAVGRVLGIDVICHGSDRPYADAPPTGPRRRRAARASGSAIPPACSAGTSEEDAA